MLNLINFYDSSLYFDIHYGCIGLCNKIKSNFSSFYMENNIDYFSDYYGKLN